jgi:hypothetical protein
VKFLFLVSDLRQNRRLEEVGAAQSRSALRANLRDRSHFNGHSRRFGKWGARPSRLLHSASRRMLLHPFLLSKFCRATHSPLSPHSRNCQTLRVLRQSGRTSHGFRADTKIERQVNKSARHSRFNDRATIYFQASSGNTLWLSCQCRAMLIT